MFHVKKREPRMAWGVYRNNVHNLTIWFVMIEIDGSTCRMWIVVDGAANFHRKSKSVLPSDCIACRSITRRRTRRRTLRTRRNIIRVCYSEENFIGIRKKLVAQARGSQGFLYRLLYFSLSFSLSLSLSLFLSLSLSLSLSRSFLPPFSRGSHYIY